MSFKHKMKKPYLLICKNKNDLIKYC